MQSIRDLIGKCSSLEKFIFYHISKIGSLSKPDLVKNFDLKHATMSRVVDSLIEKGLIIQTETGISSNVGRKPRLLSVNPNAFYMIGVDISRIHTGIILTDASLKKVEYLEFDMKDNISSSQVFEKITEIINNLMDKHSVSKEKVLGIGIGAVGKIDKENGVIIYADNFGAPWHNIRVREILQGKFGIPVSLENGADAATFAEFTLGSARNYKYVLFINIGIGIRCGIISDGKIVHNINNIDSSYGHIAIEPSGRKCYCGNYGCMVMYSTIRPILEEFTKAYKLQNLNLIAKNVDDFDIYDVLELAEKGHPLASAVLMGAAGYMGVGLANLISILNPEIVVLGGPLTEGSNVYYKKTIETARSRIFRVEERNLTFSKAYFEKEAISIGMCTLILDKHFGRQN